jgi:hypothetical protein
LDAVLDFVAGQHPNTARFSAIITNPPFGNRGKLAEQFIETGLRQLIDFGFMALLLPVDFDSAKTRPRFFASCSHFAGKIILAKRIVWFANPDPKRENPKENSAWFLWSRNVIRGRPPIIRYAPRMLERKMTRHARQLDLFRQVAPLPPHDRSHGLSVQMAMPCRCGATLAVIGPGKAPHAAALHCEGCDVHRGWVSHATHRFLIELINRFGRPVEPVAIRRGGQ